MSLRLEMSEPGRQYVLLADKNQAQGNARGLQHLQGCGHNDIRTDIAAHARRQVRFLDGHIVSDHLTEAVPA